MSIFEAHFRRLHARYGAGQTHELQMQEIAAIFGCSVRNCRIALKKMHQKKMARLAAAARTRQALTTPPVNLTGKAVQPERP